MAGIFLAAPGIEPLRRIVVEGAQFFFTRRRALTGAMALLTLVACAANVADVQHGRELTHLTAYAPRIGTQCSPHSARLSSCLLTPTEQR